MTGSATNLMIANPGIPWAAVATASSVAWQEEWTYRNTISGERYQAGLAVPGPDFNIEYDLGTGVTDTPTHLIIARADKIKAHCTQITIDSTTTGIGGVYTTRQTIASFGSATLTGPWLNDYILTGLSLGSYRGWRLSFTGGADVTPKVLHKAYLGQAFDMGRNPDYTINRIPSKLAKFYAGSGASWLTRVEDPIYQFSFTWDGVTDAKATEFETKILRMSEVFNHRFFLYTVGDASVLDNQSLVHVALVPGSCKSVKSAKAKDWNTITADFQEILG